MKKENMMKMIDLYLLSHVPSGDEFSETEGTMIIKDVIDSELDELYGKEKKSDGVNIR